MVPHCLLHDVQSPWQAGSPPPATPERFLVSKHSVCGASSPSTDVLQLMACCLPLSLSPKRPTLKCCSWKPLSFETYSYLSQGRLLPTVLAALCRFLYYVTWHVLSALSRGGGGVVHMWPCQWTVSSWRAPGPWLLALLARRKVTSHWRKVKRC